MGLWGVGLGVRGWGLGIGGLDFGVWGLEIGGGCLGFELHCSFFLPWLGCGGWCLGCGDRGGVWCVVWCRVWGCGVWGVGCGVWGVGCGVW